jgi:Protein of unknown function DUF262./HNH endonuclease.
MEEEFKDQGRQPQPDAAGIFPNFLINAKSADLPIGLLKSNHFSYPRFQRDKVWSYSKKRKFIDTCLRGFFTPPLVVCRKNGQSYLIDGWQRLSTIVEYLADGFATAKVNDDPALPPVEVNKRYSQLSPKSKAALDAYTLHISIIEDLDDRQYGSLFIRLQHQQPLIIAEKLWTYESELSKCAESLINHSFWKSVYSGNPARRRPFQASLYLLGVELAQGYTNLTSTRLRYLASGLKDTLLSPDLVDTIQQRLDKINNVFAGTKIQAMRDVIPLYQAALLLEQANYNLLKSPTGCLTPWFDRAKQDSLEIRRIPGKTDPLSKIDHSRYQSEFWDKEREQLFKVPGLYQNDRKRAFSKFDMKVALERQRGLCPLCDKPVSLSDEGHHWIQYGKGGPTTPENCMVIHKECHERFHAFPGLEWRILREDDEDDSPS